MAENKTPVRKTIAEEYSTAIIQQLKEGTAPWQKSWKAGELRLPFNPISGTRYKGVNVMMLAMYGYADPRWMTYKQADGKDWQVKKGSKSQHVVFWQFTDEKPALDENGKPRLDENGDKIMETIELDRPRLFVYNVFHASQILGKDGVDIPPFEAQTPDWNPHERAEAILKNSGAVIVHDQLDRAFYRPGDDTIHLPPKENFPDAGAYYATALHELGHWMGHESRLNWDTTKAPFGSADYAREELRVDIASWMTCQELGLPFDPGHHVAYTKSWIQALEDDNYEIMRACQAAEKINGRLMDMERGITFGQGMESGNQGMTESAQILNSVISQAVSLNLAAATPEEIHSALSQTALEAETAMQSPDYGAPGTEIESLFLEKIQYLAARGARVEDQSFNRLDVLDHARHEIFLLGNIQANRVGSPDQENIQEWLEAYYVHYNELGPAELELTTGSNTSFKQDFDNGRQDWCLNRDTSQLLCREDENSPWREPNEQEWTMLEEAGTLNITPVLPLKDGRLLTFDGRIHEALEIAQTKAASDEKIDLNVPFREKGQAKELGATWDNAKKLWCARPGVDLEPLRRWIPENTRQTLVDKGILTAPEAGQAVSPAISADQKQAVAEKAAAYREPAPEKTFLVVPFKDKDLAKEHGAKWDGKAKLWYAPEGADLAPLAKYLPERTPDPSPAQSPERELTQALENAGLKVDGLPVLDGKIHRVPSVDGKPGNRDGSYCVYPDGRPAGWMMNYRTGGQQVKWVYSGQALTVEQKTKLLLEAEERKVAREAEREVAYAAATEKAADKWLSGNLEPAFGAHSYLKNKGIMAFDLPCDLKNDCDGNLMVPGRDVQGRLQTIQTITAQGEKKFEPGCRKAGAMHLIDGQRGQNEDGSTRKIEDVKNPQIFISEGFATGASVYLATESPVVVAFDANNLKAVAAAIREVLPDAKITICADNDHKTDKNVGLEKAQEAAQAVGGDVIAPEFTPEEMAQGLTDFNDLHQSRGLGAVRSFIQDKQLGKAAMAVKKPAALKPSAGMGL